MEEMNTKLNVSLNGRQVEIDVLDIVESSEYQKEYIIYSIVELNNEEVFVSILNETEETYSLDTISDEKEYKHVVSLLEEILG